MLKISSRKAKILWVLAFIPLIAELFQSCRSYLPEKLDSKVRTHIGSLNKSKLINASITFCVTPYPVTKYHYFNIYWITFGSYLRSSPNTRVLVLSSQSYFDPNNEFVPRVEKKYGKGRIDFYDAVETDEDGVPYVDSWFVEGYHYAKTDIVCFINPDIIVMDGWLERAKYAYSVMHSLKKQTVIIGRRCLLDLDTKILIEDFDYVNGGKKCKLDNTRGLDYYLFSLDYPQINMDEFPNFHMGRFRWDSWFGDYLFKNVQLISFRNYVVLHINHKTTRHRDNKDVPKVAENEDLYMANTVSPGGSEQYVLAISNIASDDHWVLEEKK